MHDRHESEKSFHDSKYEEKSHYPRHYLLNPTSTVFHEIKKMLGDIRGKRILEYGCGEGWLTIELAMLGGVMDSFDISSVAVDHARRLLQRQGINTHYTISMMTAEQLEYPDDSFDVVVGFAILHHLDLKQALKEMYRVMKKGGIAYFAEPLGSNPIINAYRRITPQYRTIDEKPLIIEEFQRETKHFLKFDHSEYYLTALMPLALSYLHLPNVLVQKMIRKFIILDRWILTRMPSLGRYAWYTIIRLEK